jgi:hypothetical protein
VFPVRYELNINVLSRRQSVFKELKKGKRSFTHWKGNKAVTRIAAAVLQSDG